MQAKEALKWATQQLKENKVSEPEKSAEFLLRQVLGSSLCHSRPPLSFPRRRESLRRINSGGNPVRDRGWIITHNDYELSRVEEEQFRQFIARRKKHEPVWYITGRIEFYGLDLEVNQDVLIPRPETEFLVEEVLSVIPAEAGIQRKDCIDSRLCGNDSKKGGNDNAARILELGTGSGAITLALAKNAKCDFYASDISSDALKIAKKNAKRLGLDSRSGSGMTKIVGIEFRQGDLLAPWHGEVFDIIVANLPYIPHEDLDSLALDIHHWEPRVALDGGKEGLEIYERLIKQAKDYLNENYQMFFEIGIGQGKGIRKLVEKYLPEASVEIKKDYGDIDRIAIIKG